MPLLDKSIDNDIAMRNDLLIKAVSDAHAGHIAFDLDARLHRNYAKEWRTEKLSGESL